GFHLGTAVTRIAEAADRGSDGVDPLREAMWLIARYVAIVEKRPIGADLHAASVRLAGDGEEIAELSRLAAALEEETAAVSMPLAATPPEPAEVPEAPLGGADDDVSPTVEPEPDTSSPI